MGNHAVSYQSPQPEVVIWRPDKSGTPLCFDISKRTLLQAYSFGNSINDEKGRFSLTFYPGDEENFIGLDDAIFDEIHVMDIVEIYETNNHFIQKPHYEQGITTPNIIVKEVVPTFTGVIREKKFATQKTENGATRKCVVTGCSIVGLVHEFKMNFDMQATVITKELANNEEIQKQFTIKFIQNDNAPLKVADVIKEIWNSYIDLSKKYGKSSNPKIGEHINKWVGEADDIFDVDDSVFHYPIASIFKGQTTQTFFDVIANLIPKPVYEIFPYTEVETGKMRLKIREVPFDTIGENTWKNFMKPIEINPKYVKSFDVKQTDNEVYTVFFSYLVGYPLQEDKAIVLAMQGIGDMPNVEIDEEKFKVYGYRPLFVSFNGYGKADGTEDTGTGDRLKKLNERLKNWYENKDKFFSGSITMETDLSVDMPQAGEKISFLGGEFYVTDSEHNWTFGGSPETKLTIDRGGYYRNSKGTFEELTGISKRYKQFRELQNAS